MLENVLGVAGPVLQPTDQFDEFTIDAVYPDIECGLFARFLNARFDFFVNLFDNLFNSRGMDPAVINQSFQRNLRHLTSNRVKPRKDNRFRRVIDDHVNTGRRLDRADVPSFPAYDSSFHLLVR